MMPSGICSESAATHQEGSNQRLLRLRSFAVWRSDRILGERKIRSVPPQNVRQLTMPDFWRSAATYWKLL